MGPDLLLKIGIPLRFHDANLASVTDRLGILVVKPVMEFADKIRGLYLFGCNGSGKTYFGCALLMRAITLGKTCCRLTHEELVSSYMKNFSLPGRVTQPDVLFIDEVGKEIVVSERQNVYGPLLEKAARQRFDSLKFTIFAANIRLVDLGRMYGETLVSYIGGYCQPVSMPNEDLRRNQ